MGSALAEQWEAMAPGPQLAALIASVDPADLGDDALLELAAAAERLAGWAAEVQARAVAEQLARARPAPQVGPVGQVTAGLCLRLGVTKWSADKRVRVALACGRYPLLATALRSGTLDTDKLLALAETGAMPDPVRDRVITALLPRAGVLTHRQLADQVRRAEILTDPHGAQERHDRARADRSVRFDPTDDAMAWITAYLPADDATRIWATIDTTARTLRAMPGETRTLDQCRADAVLALTTGQIVLNPPGQTRDTPGKATCEPAPATPDRPAITGPHPAPVDPATPSPGPIPASGRGSGPTARDAAVLPDPTTPGPRPGRDPDPTTPDPGPLPAPGSGRAARDAAAPPVPAALGGAPVAPAAATGPAPGSALVPAPITPTADPTVPPTPPRLPAPRVPVVQVGVLIAATTLAGLDDLPGEITGYGPVPADLAATLAHTTGAHTGTDTTWRRLLTDPVTGVLTDWSATAYRPGRILRAAVQARDRSCTFIGCRQPATVCEHDHLTPYDHTHPTKRTHGHGQTCAHNLHPLCKHHHQLKTAGIITPTRNPTTGTTTWTLTTTGHTATHHPDPLHPGAVADTLHLHPMPAATASAPASRPTSPYDRTPPDGTDEDEPPF